MIFMGMKEEIRASGILAVNKNTGRVLLVKRSKLCPEPDLWANVGGKMDPDEVDPRVTAIREFKEEVQPDEPYDLSKLPLTVTMEGPVKFYTYLGLFENEFVPVLNEENTEYGWFDFDDLPEKLLPACDLIFRNKSGQIKRLLRKIKAKSI